MKLTEELWQDSQKNELHFWKKEAEQDNLDQRQRNAYYMSKMEGHCSLIKDFVESVDLSDKVVMDLGSGPEGFCHVLEAKRKIAVDPLMAQFKLEGYNVDANNVESVDLKAEEISSIFSDVDVVFCLNSIDHHQDPEKVVYEVFDVLKPGGHFIVLTDTRLPEQCDAYHKIPLTQDAMLRWITEAGYSLIKTQEFPHGTGNPIMQFIIHAKKPS